MDEDIRTLVQAIHGSPVMASLVISGAGSQALAWLMGVPGASRTLIEAVVPYGSRAMIDYLGWRPERYVSASTAVSLSAAAYSRGRHLSRSSQQVVGLACTAAIATDRPKRGEHRCHIAVWDGRMATVTSLALSKGLRDRPGEEMVVSRLILNALAESCGLDVRLPLKPDLNENIEVERQAIGRPLERLLEGTVSSLTFYGSGVLLADEPLRAAIFSGSFNPLHDGHRQLARVAEKRLDQPVVYELSVRNVDKPPLTQTQIEARLAQFEDERRRVVLSREPLYCDKARLFPGSTFVIGYDTAMRLVDPAYYGNDADRMHEALAIVRRMACRFLVAGRLTRGHFHTLADLPIPTNFMDLFEAIPEAEFRLDLSSTELRQRTASRG